MTPNRTAALEQAVGKLALEVARQTSLLAQLIIEQGRIHNPHDDWSVVARAADRKCDELHALFSQFSQPQEVKRDLS